jgi:hypothetical protein
MEMEILKTLIQYGALGIIAYFYIRDNSKTRTAELENNKLIMDFIMKTIVTEISTIKTAINTNINICNRSSEQVNNNHNCINQKLIELQNVIENINYDEEHLQIIKTIITDMLETNEKR